MKMRHEYKERQKALMYLLKYELGEQIEIPRGQSGLNLLSIS